MAAEVVLSGNSGQSYTLAFGTNWLCRLEELSGRHPYELLEALKAPDWRVTTLRQVVSAALVSMKDATLDQVGDVIDDMGGAAIVRASFVAKPKTDEAATAAVTTEPTVAQELVPA